MSALTRWRFHATVTGLAVLVLVLIPICSCLGSQVLSPAEIFRLARDDIAAQGATRAWQAWTGSERTDGRLKIFFGLRLKRALLAALVGAALGAAGASFQATLRNPLADPYILGISGGGCLGALCARLIFGALSFGAISVMASSFAAAAGTLFLVVTLAGGWRSPEHLLLTGVVVNALYSAAILLVSSLASTESLANISLYLMGYLKTARLEYATLGLVGACILATVFFLHTRFRALNLLAMVGDDEARALGIDPRRSRLSILLAATLLTSASVALAGPIGFVGLIVPHSMRLICGADHRLLLISSAFGGSAFLLLADVVGRSAVRGHELPVGVVTAVIGGGFFLFLLTRRRRRHS